MVETLNAVLDYERFKCCWCQNLLSVGPILNLDEKNFFCGRCNDKVNNFASNPAIKRQKFYEKLAKNCQFPCRYKDDGCEEILRWGNVQEHENKCLIGNMECLFNLKEFKQGCGCKWNGNNQDFWKHLDEVHSDMNWSEIYELDIWTQPESRFFLLSHKNENFILLLKYIDNIYYLILFRSNEQPPIEYKIEILDDTRKNSFIYSNISENFPAYIKKIKKFGTKLEFIDIIPKYLTVYFGDIRKYRFDECQRVPRLPSCNRCDVYSVLPIYNCDNGCKFCRFCCKSRHFRECQKCQTDIKTNYAETKQYLQLHYNCLLRNCYFHGNIFEMEFHFRVCKCFKAYFKLEPMKWNTPYQTVSLPQSQEFLLPDHNFLLRAKTKESYFEFWLSSYRFPKIIYEYHITFHSAEDSVLTFPIVPMFYNYLSSKFFCTEPVRVPKDLFHENTFSYSLNFSEL